MASEYDAFCNTSGQMAIMELHDQGLSSRDIAPRLGTDSANARKVVRQVKARAASKGYSPQHDMTHTVPDGYTVKGTSTLYKEGEPVIQWVKTNQDAERQLEIMREMVEAITADVKPIPPAPPPSHNFDHLMSIYPMGDPHLGLYCWAKETGDDFDLDIAERDLCAAVDYLVEQSPPSSRAILMNLGDFFHTENMDGTTSRSGNVLDMDTRFSHMVDVGIRTLRRCIDSMLRKHQTVEVINAPGNHDETLALFLPVLFRNLYENEPRIVVHGNECPRIYIEHGKCLVGAVHGHQTKDAGLIPVMAAEKSEAWGRTKYRVFFRGHQHHDSRVEYTGGVVEQVRTLAAGDAYAVGHGYLSGRDMKCIVMHKDYGEQSRFTCGIDVLREKKNL